MLHILLDTSIYRNDPKRNKPAFRALTRLGHGQKMQIHIPYYVKKKFITQQYSKILTSTRAIQSEADSILRTTSHDKLERSVAEVQRATKELCNIIESSTKEEFDNWIKESRAVEHPVSPEHAQRVTDDYFSGAPPFKAIKNRNDIPDSFIWQTVIDLLKEYTEIHVITDDGALYQAAVGCRHVVAHKKLEDFIQLSDCQKALTELTNETVATNVNRAKQLLSKSQSELLHSLDTHIVNALNGVTLHHPDIPDDNHEAMILSVDNPEDVTFEFKNVEYYGEGELGLPFSALVECILSYSISKSKYFTLNDERALQISVDELNDHYFDAEENYKIKAEGVLSIILDKEQLENDLTDEDISDLIHDADNNVEIVDADVVVPYE